MKRGAFFFQTNPISMICGGFGWKKNADLCRLSWLVISTITGRMEVTADTTNRLMIVTLDE